MNSFLGFILLVVALTHGTNAFADDSLNSFKVVSAVRDFYPDWSPDGTKLVFNSDRGTGIGKGFDLYVLQIDSAQVTRITSTPESEEAPVWSPDGKRILFSSYLTDDNSELFLVNPDGSDPLQITDSPGRDGHAKFSPDGVSIVFNSQRDEKEGYEIYEMNLQSSKTKRLTNFKGWDTYPDISPDGTKILWRRVLPTGGSSKSGRNSEIFVMNRDGSNPKNISNHADFDGYPSWSHDGSRIVFASNRNRKNNDRGNFHIFTMSPDGTDVKMLWENGLSVEDARPRWSPDGTKLVFNRQYVADESSIDILIYNQSK